MARQISLGHTSNSHKAASNKKMRDLKAGVVECIFDSAALQKILNYEWVSFSGKQKLFSRKERQTWLGVRMIN